MQLPLADENATSLLGAKLAVSLQPGSGIYLRGELGTGKTTLVRACLKALGYAGRVKSPTYTLVEPYELSRLSLYHFDFYRLQGAQEWLEAGFRDYFNDNSVCLVEWPEKAGTLLPSPDLEIRLKYANPGRSAEIEALSSRGLLMLQSISNGAA